MPWSIINLAVSFAAFGFLARLSACNRDQPSFATRELADNTLYWFTNVLFYGGMSGVLLKGAVTLVLQGRAPEALAAIATGYGWLGHAPLWLQAVLVIVVLDIVQYWLHRLFHTETLWLFHAIHHSAEQPDWTTTYRIHPVNFALYAAGAFAMVQLLGFSPAAYLVIGPFNLVIGALVHANLDWTFGPLRYVIASPVFHRWHHSRDAAARDRNFAPTFPVLDLLFGTFYMPRGVLPANYGAEGVPSNFVGQMIYPFAALVERLGPGQKVRPGRATA
jgi:sterol desaturase/sphingolipid hydroxylase (fatty acid hydroxylase superfamily)